MGQQLSILSKLKRAKKKNTEQKISKTMAKQWGGGGSSLSSKQQNLESLNITPMVSIVSSVNTTVTVNTPQSPSINILPIMQNENITVINNDNSEKIKFTDKDHYNLKQTNHNQIDTIPEVTLSPYCFSLAATAATIPTQSLLSTLYLNKSQQQIKSSANIHCPLKTRNLLNIQCLTPSKISTSNNLSKKAVLSVNLLYF